MICFDTLSVASWDLFGRFYEIGLPIDSGHIVEQILAGLGGHLLDINTMLQFSSSLLFNYRLMSIGIRCEASHLPLLHLCCCVLLVHASCGVDAAVKPR